jgi:hypothetical protein
VAASVESCAATQITAIQASRPLTNCIWIAAYH